MDKNSFFRQATLMICGNLEVEEALKRLLGFLNKSMPVTRFFLQRFDRDFDASFATYTVSNSGFVSISFASDMPDELYSEVLNELKTHPGIKGVLAGKSFPPCNAW